MNQMGTQAIVVLDMKTGDVAWISRIDASTSRLLRWKLRKLCTSTI